MTAEAVEAGTPAGPAGTFAAADRPLRIALLTYKGNPYCGGQGVYVRHLSRELARLGHSVEVIGAQPYPVLDEGVPLTELGSLDLYRQPDPFRTPKRGEYRDWIDALEVATMWTGGFPEPLTFSLRARRHLAARRGEFDVVHDNQTLGYGLLGDLGAPSSPPSTTPSPSTGGWRSTPPTGGAPAPPYVAGTASPACRSASRAGCPPWSPSPAVRSRRSPTTSECGPSASGSSRSAPTRACSHRTRPSPRSRAGSSPPPAPTCR